jgi:hypothetical protein
MADPIKTNASAVKGAPEESKAERFVRLASARVSAAQDAMNKVGVLANKGSYEYTDEQIDKIEKALQSAISVNVGALRSGKSPRVGGFVL